MEHPAVMEAAVVGLPDPARTEVAVAYVVLSPGTEASPVLAAALQRHVRARLSAHAYPREVRFVAELPKTPSGKLQRFVLRAQEAFAASAQPTNPASGLARGTTTLAQQPPALPLPSLRAAFGAALRRWHGWHPRPCCCRAAASRRNEKAISAEAGSHQGSARPAPRRATPGIRGTAPHGWPG